MSRDEKSFHYFVADKNPFLVVTFVGKIDFKAMGRLSECKTEIVRGRSAKFVVFYFRDVDTVTGDAIGVLTQMQLELRAKGLELNCCSLKPEIREKLLNMGVVRASELSNNMKEALLAFVPVSAGGTKIKKSA